MSRGLEAKRGHEVGLEREGRVNRALSNLRNPALKDRGGFLVETAMMVGTFAVIGAVIFAVFSGTLGIAAGTLAKVGAGVGAGAGLIASIKESILKIENNS